MDSVFPSAINLVSLATHLFYLGKMLKNPAEILARIVNPVNSGQGFL